MTHGDYPNEAKMTVIFFFKKGALTHSFLFSLNSKGILRATPSNLGFNPIEFSLHARPMRYYKNIPHKVPVNVIVIVDVEVIKTFPTEEEKKEVFGSFTKENPSLGDWGL